MTIPENVFKRWQAIPYYKSEEDTPESLPEQSTELKKFSDSISVDFYRLISTKRALIDNYEDAEDFPEIGIVDMLIDVRHLCDALGLNFFVLYNQAYQCYLEERQQQKEISKNK